MEYIMRKNVDEDRLPGRMMQRIVGKTTDGYLVPSEIMHVGYCRYCQEAGPMSPHMHAEETVLTGPGFDMAAIRTHWTTSSCWKKT